MSNIFKYVFVLLLGLLLTDISSVLYAEASSQEQNKSSSSSESSTQESKFQAIYGHMDMYFGMMRTVYKDYKQSLFYPQPQWGGFLGVNYNYFRKYFSLGGGVRFGFYKDRGNPSQYIDRYEKDKSTKLTRPLFPVQAQLTLGVTPFFDKFYFIPKKLITLRGWIGFEYLYGQEQRISGDEDAYVDGVRVRSLVFGVSPWILISFLDQKTANTAYVLNVKAIYLSPYFEWTKTLNKDRVKTARQFNDKGKTINITQGEKLDYNRKIFGIAVTFETL